MASEELRCHHSLLTETPGAAGVPLRAVSGREGARPPWGGSLSAARQSCLFPQPWGLGLTIALHPTPFLASCPRLNSTESLTLENPSIWYAAAHSSCHADSDCLLRATLTSLASLLTAGEVRRARACVALPALVLDAAGTVCMETHRPVPVTAAWSFCHWLGGPLQGPLKSLSPA